jgi:hypothetical protein
MVLLQMYRKFQLLHYVYEMYGCFSFYGERGTQRSKSKRAT